MRPPTLLVLLILAVGMPSCSPDVERRHLEIMEIHDEVMPMIADMSRLRRQLEAGLEQRDSTGALQVREVTRELLQAERAMWDWMAQYRKPEKGDAEAIRYLEEQREAIQQVSDAMKSSFARAQEIQE